MDCNLLNDDKFGAASFDAFQSLIGILMDCNVLGLTVKPKRRKQLVSIPNRDFDGLQSREPES